MQKLEKQDGLDALLAMRAVSKAWRAAFEGYAGTVINSRRLTYEYEGGELYDWPRISSIQPHMAHLRISAYGTSTMSLQSYQSLQACSDLRSLSIAACGPKSHHYPVGLHLLPKSLVAITLLRVQMFKTFSMSRLTRVCLGGLRNEPSSVWQKLKKLTQLKVGLHSSQICTPLHSHRGSCERLLGHRGSSSAWHILRLFLNLLFAFRSFFLHEDARMLNYGLTSAFRRCRHSPEIHLPQADVFMNIICSIGSITCFEDCCIVFTYAAYPACHQLPYLRLSCPE